MVKQELSVKEFARLGGLARWKGIPQKKRREMMSEMAKKPRKTRSKHLDKKLSTAPSK